MASLSFAFTCYPSVQINPLNLLPEGLRGPIVHIAENRKITGRRGDG